MAPEGLLLKVILSFVPVNNVAQLVMNSIVVVSKIVKIFFIFIELFFFLLVWLFGYAPFFKVVLVSTVWLIKSLFKCLLEKR